VAVDGLTDSQLASISTVSPSALAVNTEDNTIYVTNSFSGTISLIDGDNNTIVSEGVEVGNSPQDIVVNSNTGKAYISNSGSNSVTVVYP
jgi:YVTN family beta-propeller protein